MSQKTGHAEPTAKQLSYLKALANQTATSFAYPRTRRQASAEIERLKTLKRSGRKPLPELAGSERDLTYATAVCPEEEVAGWGASAHWRGGEVEPQTPSERKRLKVGQRSELARYRAGSEERVLYRQQVGGSVRITDRPAAGGGRAFLVERELQQDGEKAIEAIVADYVREARRLDRVPMASAAGN